MNRNALTSMKECGYTAANAAAVFAALVEAGDLYPSFDKWFWQTVVPGLGHDRSIFVEWVSGTIAGVVIAKRSVEERKLCTVWVDDRLRNRGVASRLVDQSCSWLGSRAPMLTIPSERLGEFAGILKSGHFSQTQALDAYYRAGSREYVFNGELPVRPHACADAVKRVLASVTY